ncbi:MAG: hypothetical protein K6F72_00650 [Bacteroidales bacterium]|nr:hypothetical protein [Bacteroidales bacterium]
MASRGRKANDGRGRIGGRQAGTPNKDKPLKAMLHDHSVNYFTANITAEEIDLRYFMPPMGKDDSVEVANRIAIAAKEEFVAKHKDETFSQYELDIRAMKPVDRAKAELDMLNYHMPKMQAISADMSVKANSILTDRLRRLAAGEDINADEN